MRSQGITVDEDDIAGHSAWGAAGPECLVSPFRFSTSNRRIMTPARLRIFSTFQVFIVDKGLIDAAKVYLSLHYAIRNSRINYPAPT
jgi:hypothetical protein